MLGARKLPVMTFVKFRYITKDRDRHGNLRFYFRRPGKPKMRLRGLPGSEEFLAAYSGALAEDERFGSKAYKSFDWLCERYYKSSYFMSLEEYTQRRKRTVLDEICNIAGNKGKRLGSAPYAAMKKVHVRKLRDMKANTPEAANFRLKQIEDVETFEAHWSPGSRPRLAMSIMLYLGVRRSDAVLIGKKHESSDGGSVTFAQFKGRKKWCTGAVAADLGAAARDSRC
jgi:integrase